MMHNATSSYVCSMENRYHIPVLHSGVSHVVNSTELFKYWGNVMVKKYRLHILNRNTYEYVGSNIYVTHK